MNELMSSPEPDSKTWSFVSENEAETDRLGVALASVIDSGLVIALLGDLGAGKTRLVQAVASDLGADRESVNSPTFVLIQEYQGRLPIYHMDAYRLRDADEFLELGAAELMESCAVCLIEWADRIGESLPDDVLRVQIHMTGPASRVFDIRGTGPRSAGLLVRLRRAIQS